MESYFGGCSGVGLLSLWKISVKSDDNLPSPATKNCVNSVDEKKGVSPFLAGRKSLVIPETSWRHAELGAGASIFHILRAVLPDSPPPLQLPLHIAFKPYKSLLTTRIHRAFPPISISKRKKGKKRSQCWDTNLYRISSACNLEQTKFHVYEHKLRRKYEIGYGTMLIGVAFPLIGNLKQPIRGMS